MIFCLLALSVVSSSFRPRGLKPARLFCPWDFPGKNAELGCHSTSPKTVSSRFDLVVLEATFGFSWGQGKFPMAEHMHKCFLILILIDGLKFNMLKRILKLRLFFRRLWFPVGLLLQMSHFNVSEPNHRLSSPSKFVRDRSNATQVKGQIIGNDPRPWVSTLDHVKLLAMLSQGFSLSPVQFLVKLCL